MNSRSEIINELNQISSVVANLNGKLPFELPEGYFDNFADLVLNRIQQNEPAALPWPKTAQQLPFEAPRDYFDNLPQNILQRIKAIESSSPKDEIEALSPLLGRLNRKLPYELPQDYFTALPEEIVSGVNAIDFVNQELESLSPAMMASKNINVYEVPQDYFDTLPQEVLNKVGQKPAKVISFNAGRRMLPYAAAAILTGAIALGAWMFFSNKPAAVAGTEITGIEQISNAEMRQYLEKTPIVMPDVSVTASAGPADIKEEDVKALLADISDKELQQYLDQYTTLQKATTN